MEIWALNYTEYFSSFQEALRPPSWTKEDKQNGVLTRMTYGSYNTEQQVCYSLLKMSRL